jgi:hypothetical protein
MMFLTGRLVGVPPRRPVCDLAAGMRIPVIRRGARHRAAGRFSEPQKGIAILGSKRTNENV